MQKKTLRITGEQNQTTGSGDITIVETLTSLGYILWQADECGLGKLPTKTKDASGRRRLRPRAFDDGELLADQRAENRRRDAVHPPDDEQHQDDDQVDAGIEHDEVGEGGQRHQLQHDARVHLRDHEDLERHLEKH